MTGIHRTLLALLLTLSGSAGEIELLPALPKAWPNGSVKGLRARGGFALDIQWKDHKLVNATVHALVGGPCRLCHGAITHDLNLDQGQIARWTVASFDTKRRYDL